MKPSHISAEDTATANLPEAYGQGEPSCLIFESLVRARVEICPRSVLELGAQRGWRASTFLHKPSVVREIDPGRSETPAKISSSGVSANRGE